MKVFIIGADGQLGLEMQRQLTHRNISFDAYDIPKIDIVNIESVREVMKSSEYTAVVNCAAYTNVDGAESEYDLAYKINALGAKNIAILCKEYDVEMIHISTDYVFSGEGILKNGEYRAYVETDECKPVTAYGKTKLAGEIFVKEKCDKSYILRTAWLYGEGNNFVKTMIKLSKNNDDLNIVNDQFGSPTSTVDLANAVCNVLNSGEYGLFHATCEGFCTWYDFALEIFKLMKIDIKVKPVTSKEFIKPAKRPNWSVLKNANLIKLEKNIFRNWKQSLAEYLDNYKE